MVFLAIFMLPTGVKLTHHHDHELCHAKNENHFHSGSSHCPVCDFEFSIFLAEDLIVSTPITKLSDAYFPSCWDYHDRKLIQYNFLLRAPPASQV